MKAGVIATAGATPVYADFAEPVVSPERELVELVATGIHPIVRAMASGSHYGSAGIWPLVPGVDAVARTADGALVYTGYVQPPYGTVAERMAVPRGMRLSLPAGADPVLIAGGLNPGIASWMPLAARAAELSQQGQASLGTVLILGATGTAGMMAVQNALALGATRVVAVGRDAARLAEASTHGAQATIRLTGAREADAAAIRAGLGETDPSLVLDFVWGSVAAAAWTALARHGLDEDAADIVYNEIGALAGEEAALPASLLRSRRIRIQGSGAGSADVGQIMREIPRYMALLASGKVTMPLCAMPLSQVEAAWTAAAGAGERVVVTGPAYEAAAALAASAPSTTHAVSHPLAPPVAPTTPDTPDTPADDMGKTTARRKWWQMRR